MENTDPNLKLLQIIANEDAFAPIDSAKKQQRNKGDSTTANQVALSGQQPLNESSNSEARSHQKPVQFKIKGRIEMIIGPMFAGKSTELLRRMRRNEIAGKQCLYIKYIEDTRYDTEQIATHDK
jgi:thymidine kinase